MEQNTIYNYASMNTKILLTLENKYISTVYTFDNATIPIYIDTCVT